MTRLVEEVRKEHGDSVCEIELEPLQPQQVCCLVADTFRCALDEAEPLAAVVCSKSLGNPFFVSTLLRLFHEAGLVKFHFGGARWMWSIDDLRKFPVPEDILSVLCIQIKALSTDCQTALQYAACLGNSFHLHMLGAITEMGPAALIRTMRELEAAGLVMCAKNAQRLLLLSLEAARTEVHASDSGQVPHHDSRIAADLESVEFRFVHDACSAQRTSSSRPTDSRVCTSSSRAS